MNQKAKKISLYGMLLALSMVLSYIEAILPFGIGVPGVKLGLPNIVTVVGLYSIGTPATLLISFARILLVAMSFGNAMTIAYSLAGFFLSFGGMLLLKSWQLSRTAVSICGGVLHNLGQLLTAMLLLHSPQLLLYFPVLLAAGIAAGAAIGLTAGALSTHLHRFLQRL